MYSEISLLTFQVVRFGRGFDSHQVHQLTGLQRIRRADVQGNEMTGGRLPDSQIAMGIFTGTPRTYYSLRVNSVNNKCQKQRGRNATA